MKNIHYIIYKAIDKRLDEMYFLIRDNTDGHLFFSMEEEFEDTIHGGFEACRDDIQVNFHRHLVRKLQDEIEVLRKDRKDYL